MKVPFLDLKQQYNSIDDEILNEISKVIRDTAFSGGPFVSQFEKSFASFCENDYAIGVGSGTEALWLALMAFGIGPGDEVITTANTFIATAEAISLCGAQPVLVDIDEKTFNMDPSCLEEAISDYTRAIIPVHLYGQMADMFPIMEIAKKHNLIVIEDSCQSHGARYHDHVAGSIGDAGCFSFYPGKNLGAFGEAGAVVTRHASIAEGIALLRDHGQPQKYHHKLIGMNSRMDGIQAAILNVKMKYLPNWNRLRAKAAWKYEQQLGEIEEILLPHETEYGRHVYHIYAIRTANRNDFMDYLRDRDISCGIHYPIPVHLQEAYQFLGYRKGSFPVTEKCAAELVSLPMFPELTDLQIDYVCDEIANYVEIGAKKHRKSA